MYLGRLIFWVSLNLLTLNIQAQENTDSLIAVYESDVPLKDSARLYLLEDIYSSRALNPLIALKYAQKSLEIAQQLGNHLFIYKSEYELGHIHKKKGDLDEAIKHYLNALKVNKHLNEPRNAAIVYSSLATTYRAANDFEKAQTYAEKGIEIHRELKDSISLAITLMNTGEANRLQKNFQLALDYFKESGEIFSLINYEVGKAYNIGNIGLVYQQLSKNALAEQYLNEAVEVLKKNTDYYPLIVYNLSLAEIYNSRGQKEKAIELVKKNLAYAHEYALTEQIRDVNLKLSELYEENENFQKAYHHHQQYVQYRDSLNNEETIREMADLQAEYEISQKQIEVDLLEEKQKRQNIIFVGLLVIILLLVVLLFLYYRNLKRKQALNMIILERKEEAEAQRDQLEAINQTKEKFLSIISHDLLGPVNSMKGLTSLLKVSIDSNSKKDLEHIHKLFDDSVRNLSSLLTNLLDWSVTQQGAIPYKPQTISLYVVVNELLALFANMAQTKNITLRSTVTRSAKLWADEDSLKTILRNLVSNSIKFTLANGEITISNVVKDNFIVIKVSDTGLGMTQEKIDELMAEDKFSQSHGTSGEKGVGLGLQLVKEFVRVNKGWIEIASKEGKGTTFSIYLPLNEYQIV